MLKVGVKLPAWIDSPGEWLADARALEAAGVHSLWLSESLVRPVGQKRPYAPALDPWTLMAALAAVTHEVRLGTSVSVVAMWSPVLFATVITTLEHLSRGRVIVGVGAGWEPVQFTSNGLEFADRGRRLDEFIAAVRRLWSDPEQGFQGDFYQVPPVRLAAPVRPQGPPLLVGAFSDPGYRRAARRGDGFIAGGGGPEKVAAAFRRVLELRDDSGSQGDFELWAQVGAPDGRDDWRRTLTEYESIGATGLIVAFNPRLLDLLRNPDQEDERSDLGIAQG